MSFIKINNLLIITLLELVVMPLCQASSEISITFLGIVKSVGADLFMEDTNEYPKELCRVNYAMSVESLQPRQKDVYLVYLLRNCSDDWVGLRACRSKQERIEREKWYGYSKWPSTCACGLGFPTIRPHGELLFFVPVPEQWLRNDTTRLRIEYYPDLGKHEFMEAHLVERKIYSPERSPGDFKCVSPERLLSPYLLPSGKIRLPCAEGL